MAAYTICLYTLFVVMVDMALAISDPLVQTTLGKVEGHWMTSRSGRRFQAFSGVPYAKPPINELTFQPPVELKPWSSVLKAKTNGPRCLQYNLFRIEAEAEGKEDCLYLSIYTHNLPGEGSPVLVHFHGDAFISDYGVNRTGPQYFMDEDIVIVEVNYRLGIYGFLSFEDKHMPGNQGMKDQVMALKWVQQNIASFGGDPNKVTLVGEGAGGASVYHHTVSPLSKGLFHGAISESGSSYSQWALAPKGFVRSLAIKLLQLLGCNYTNDTNEAVNCIRKKDHNDVVSKLETFREWQVDPSFNFGPVLEPPAPGAFLVGPIEKWNHSEVPLITGVNSGDGLVRTSYFHYLNLNYKWYSDNFEKLAPISLQYFASSSKPDKVTKAVRQYYLSGPEITPKDWVNITTMYGDSLFTIPGIEAADRHKGNVYFYYFDYLGEKGYGARNGKRNTTFIFGSPHTEETVYLWWYKPFDGLKGEDLELSKKLVKIWTDFCKYGTPAPEGSGLDWKTWTPERHRYIHISKKGFELEEGLAEDRYRFWKNTDYRDNYS